MADGEKELKRIHRGGVTYKGKNYFSPALAKHEGKVFRITFFDKRCGTVQGFVGGDCLTLAPVDAPVGMADGEIRERRVVLKKGIIFCTGMGFGIQGSEII